MKSGFFIALLLLFIADVSKAQTTDFNSIEHFSLDLNLENQESPPYIYFDSTEAKYYLLFNYKKNELFSDKDAYYSGSLTLVVTDISFNILWKKAVKLEKNIFKYFYPSTVLNNKDKLYFLYTRKQDKIGGLIIDKNDRTVLSNQELMTSGENEDFICVLNDENSHYAVGYEKSNKQINFYPISEEGKVGDKKTFQLPDPEKYNYKTWLKAVASIDNTQSVPLVRSCLRNKVFLWKDLAVFTWIDKDAKSKVNYVSVMKLNIKTMQSSVEKWGLPDVFGQAENYIYHDKFFIFKYGDSGMSLLISNLDTPKEVIKSYNTLTGPINFRNSELVEEEYETTLYYGLSDNSKEDVKASKKFIDKLGNYFPGVTVRENGEDYEICMGAANYKDVNYFDSYLLNLSSPVYVINSSLNVMNSKLKRLGDVTAFNQPNKTGVSLSLGLRTNSNIEFYFKSLINKNTLEHHKGAVAHLYRDIEQEFNEKIQPDYSKYDNVGYYTINGKDYYTFYSPKKKQFRIVREH